LLSVVCGGQMESRMEIEIPHGDIKGKADAKLFVPEGAGPWPLVVFYTDAGGLRPSMSLMASHLLGQGFAVLQPNLYWRSGPQEPFDAATVFSNPTERQRLMDLMATISHHDVMSDTMLFVEHLATYDHIRSDVFGVLGYCMGGRLAFVAASALASMVVAAASIHGGGLVAASDESPHRDAHRIRGRLYLGVADHDGSCTPEHQSTLHQVLGEAAVRYELELYPGARHGFAVPDTPAFDPLAAARHWEKVLALFGSELKAK
jgi:carboxymethylenebutenolidase